MTEKQKAADVLLDNGVYFETEGLFGRNKRWTIRPSKLGTLYEITRLYLRHEIDMDKFELNPMKEANEITNISAKDYAKVVAIAVLNSRWKIKFFKGILANYFYWKITPKKLLQIMFIVVDANNVLDFINTIKLTSGMAKILEVKVSPTEQGG